MSAELLAVVFVPIVAGVLIVAIAGKKWLSNPPAAWVARALAGAVGTLLLVLAIIDTGLIEEAADRLFDGTPVEASLGAQDADVIMRLLLVLAAIAFLVVPGSWMDVAAGTVLALAISAFFTHYGDTKDLLGCSSKPGVANTAQTCPTPAPTPPPPTPAGETEIAIELPKAKVVAPLTAIKEGTAVIRPVLEVHGDEGIVRTLAHKYRVKLAKDVPAEKLEQDVVLNIPAKKAKAMLADVTAAKTIYLTPR